MSANDKKWTKVTINWLLNSVYLGYQKLWTVLMGPDNIATISFSGFLVK